MANPLMKKKRKPITIIGKANLDAMVDWNDNGKRAIKKDAERFEQIYRETRKKLGLT